MQMHVQATSEPWASSLKSILENWAEQDLIYQRISMSAWKMAVVQRKGTNM